MLRRRSCLSLSSLTLVDIAGYEGPGKSKWIVDWIMSVLERTSPSLRILEAKTLLQSSNWYIFGLPQVPAVFSIMEAGTSPRELTGLQIISSNLESFFRSCLFFKTLSIIVYKKLICNLVSFRHQS